MMTDIEKGKLKFKEYKEKYAHTIPSKETELLKEYVELGRKMMEEEINKYKGECSDGN